MSDHVFYAKERWYDELGMEYLPPGWYFWDEIDQLGGGPFDTENECRVAFEKYVEALNEVD